MLVDHLVLLDQRLCVTDHGFIGERFAGVEVNADDGKFFAAAAKDGAEGRAGEARVQRPVINGLADFPSGFDQQPDAGGSGRVCVGGFCEKAIHPQPIGEFVKQAAVAGLSDHEDIGILRADDFGDRVGPTEAALKDVVAHDFHARRIHGGSPSFHRAHGPIASGGGLDENGGMNLSVQENDGAEVRAGRGAASLALLLLVPMATLGETAALHWWPGPVGDTLYGLAKLWLLTLPAFWLLRVDRQRLSWSRPERGGFLVAVLLGVLMGGAVVGAYLIVRHARLIDVGHIRTVVAQHGLNILWVYLSFMTVLSLANSLMEEYVWRWFVFRKCEALAGKYGGVIGAALFFTLHHTCALAAYFDWRVTILGSVGVFAGGVIWSAMYARYRSIWPGYVCHIMADAGITMVGYLLIF